MVNEGEEYLQMYPSLRKWINECVACHSKGFKPDLPDDIYPHPSVASYNLKKFYKPLIINENGLCEICSKLLK